MRGGRWWSVYVVEWGVRLVRMDDSRYGAAPNTLHTGLAAANTRHTRMTAPASRDQALVLDAALNLAAPWSLICCFSMLVQYCVYSRKIGVGWYSHPRTDHRHPLAQTLVDILLFVLHEASFLFWRLNGSVRQ